MSAFLHALNAMQVVDAAPPWRPFLLDAASFEPADDPWDLIDAFAYDDGGWSYDDGRDCLTFVTGVASPRNIRGAKLAVQQAHAILCMTKCNAAAWRAAGGKGAP